MTELSLTRKNHRDPMLVRGGHHLGVAHRAARLDDGFNTGLRCLIDAIAEGKEGVGPDDSPLGVMSRLLGFVNRHECRVDARHLTRADPDGHPATGEDDRVRLHRRHRAPRKQEILQLGGRRLAFCWRVPSLRVDDRWRALLYQDAAAHALEVEAARWPLRDALEDP